MATTFNYGQVAPERSPREPSFARPLKAFRVDARTGCGRTLSSLVESDIIPQLIASHPQSEPAAGIAISADEVAAFAPLALQVEADVLLDHAEAMLARGVTVESLLVDLLAPAARELGEYWKADRCDFVDVTMGLWRLQEVVHEIAARGPSGRYAAAPNRRALFAAMPGDQHGFGALVVEEMFARAGWATDRLGDASLSDLYARLGSDWFDLIGLTVSCDSHTGALPAAITALRSVSRNPRLVVMVGGRVFVEHPGLAKAVGADGTAADARAAVAVADKLVGAVAREGLPCG